MIKRFAVLLSLFFVTPAFCSVIFDDIKSGGAVAQSSFLPGEQAFAFSYQQQGQVIVLKWNISHGYYMYRDKMEIRATNASPEPFKVPPGTRHHDEFFGETEIWQDHLEIPLKLAHAGSDATLKISWQGCASAGFCYQKQTKEISLVPVAGSSAPQSLPSGSLWAALAVSVTGILLVIAISASRLLPGNAPRTGKVKTATGFLIPVAAVFLIARFWPSAELYLWSLSGTAFFIWSFVTSLDMAWRVVRLVQILCLGAAIIISRPLQDWIFH